MYFTILYVLKTIVKNNFRTAFSITILFILFLSITNNYSMDSFMSLNFIISFLMYYFFIIFGLNALKKNKILGIILLSSITSTSEAGSYRDTDITILSWVAAGSICLTVFELFPRIRRLPASKAPKKAEILRKVLREYTYL